MKVSFIGLGIMGKPMALNLLKEEKLDVVYNRTTSKTTEFQEAGVDVASTPKEAATKSDVIITMLSDSPDVEEVILGSNGVIEGVKKDAIVIDMSSINPEVSKKIGSQLKEKDVSLLDAPVSGGEKGAIDGTLAMMVGGDEAVLNRVLPILNKLGSSIVRVGDLGAGGYAKLANQIMVALHIEAMSEAFLLAEKADLDFSKLYNAIRGGLAGSHVLEQKINNLMGEDFNPGFKIDLHLKDINNALQAADSQELELPYTKNIQKSMEKMAEQGYGDLDHSSLYSYLSKIVNNHIFEEESR